MTVLITERKLDGTGRRRCDARCHTAKGETCRCICGGRNHGVGFITALENVRETARVGMPARGAIWPLTKDGWPDLRDSQDAIDFARRHYNDQVVYDLLVLAVRRYDRLVHIEREKGYPDMDAASRLAFNLQLVREALQEWECIEEEEEARKK